MLNQGLGSAGVLAAILALFPHGAVAGAVEKMMYPVAPPAAGTSLPLALFTDLAVMVIATAIGYAIWRRDEWAQQLLRRRARRPRRN